MFFTRSMSVPAPTTRPKCRRRVLAIGLTLLTLPAVSVLAQAPPPPGITATNIGASSMTLVWPYVTGGDSYTVQYAQDSKFMFILGSGSTGVIPGTTQGQLPVGGLPAATRIYFRGMTQSNTLGNSAWSYANSAVTLAAPILVPETTLTVASQDLNSATVTWTAVTGAAGYYIFDSLDKTFATGVHQSIVGTVTRVRVPNQSFGKTEYYKIQPFFPGEPVVAGTMSPATFAAIPSGVTNTLAAPQAPNCFNQQTPCSVKVTSQTAKVSWSAVTNATSYKVIQCFDVLCTSFNGYAAGTPFLPDGMAGSVALPLSTVTTTSWTTNSSTPGSIYFVRLQACNATGCGAYSSPLEVFIWP